MGFGHMPVFNPQLHVSEQPEMGAVGLPRWAASAAVCYGGLMRVGDLPLGAALSPRLSPSFSPYPSTRLRKSTECLLCVRSFLSVPQSLPIPSIFHSCSMPLLVLFPQSWKPFLSFHLNLLPPPRRPPGVSLDPIPPDSSHADAPLCFLSHRALVLSPLLLCELLGLLPPRAMSNICQFISNATLSHKSGMMLLSCRTTTPETTPTPVRQFQLRKMSENSIIVLPTPHTSSPACRHWDFGADRTLLAGLYCCLPDPALSAVPPVSWSLPPSGNPKLTARCQGHPFLSSDKNILCFPGCSCPPFSDILSSLPSVHIFPSQPPHHQPTCPCPSDFETRVHM